MSTTKLITYWIGDQIYGLPLLLAGEFYNTIQATRFDTGDPRLYGITHVRGGSAVVLDLRGSVNHEEGFRPRACDTLNGCEMIYMHADSQLCEEARAQKLVSFEEPTVLVVDRLANIQDVDKADIYPTPTNLTAPYYDGVFRIAHGDLIMLNYRNLIQSILSQVSEKN